MRAYLEIEMPKDGCTNCRLARRGSIFSRICVITEEYVDGNYERGGFPTECPLQELLPHGRLIDADAAVANRTADMNWCYDLYDLPDYLSGCPTIIPASEEET